MVQSSLVVLTLRDSSPLFVPSQVYSPDENAPKHRTSSSCFLPPELDLASVISARAMQFLSNMTKTGPPHAPNLPEPLSYYGLEKIQLVKYLPSQYYHHHMDWFDTLMRDDLPGKGEAGRGRGRYFNRVASFFIYLDDNCTGGGTEFPDLRFDIQTLNESGARGTTEFWRERIDFPSQQQQAEEGGGHQVYRSSRERARACFGSICCPSGMEMNESSTPVCLLNRAKRWA